MWFNLLIAACVGVLTYSLTLYLDRPFAPRPAVIEAPVETTLIQAGEVVPTFSFTDTKGKTHAISDFSGKTIILNFWASWCAPCVKEFPDFLQIAAQHKDDVVFIALSSDHDPEAMQRFLNKMRARDDVSFGDNVYIALDEGTKITRQIFQTYRLPETIIIDPAQQMRHKLIGADWTKDELSALLKTLR